MKILYALFVLSYIRVSVGQSNASFISQLSASIQPYCQEIQQKLKFKYGFRGTDAVKTSNKQSNYICLFTDDKVFWIQSLWAALQTQEPNKFVLPELFFSQSGVKGLTEFWDQFKPTDEVYNTAFADIREYNLAYFLFGDKYSIVNISFGNDIKVTGKGQPLDISQSGYGFLQNKLIQKKGFKNIFGVDIAGSGSFNPIRVYVRDLSNFGNAISYAFPNRTETDEQFAGGKRYNYAFNSSAFLNTGQSKAFNFNHYFELRTRGGIFTLFDIQYNRDFLLDGSNEELLGCPPSFCQWRQFDDIIRLHSGKQWLVYREWQWPFTAPGTRVVWTDAVMSNIESRQPRNNQFTKNFKFPFAIRHIVDGSFTDDSTLYIFRNGSFISSKDDTIMQSQTPFDNYTEIGSFFKGVPSQTFDALFYHKESRVVYFIIDNKYWAYSMANSGLIDIKDIKELGIPYYFKVKATYVEEDPSGKQTVFYFFTDIHYIKFDSNRFKSGKFEPQTPTFLCTSTNFLGCESIPQFSCPPYEIPGDNADNNNLWIYLLIAIIIIIALIVVIIIILCCCTSNSKGGRVSQTSAKSMAKKSKVQPKSPGGAQELSLGSHCDDMTIRSHKM